MLERRGNSPPDAIWEQMLGTNVASESIERPSSKCRFSSVSSNHGAGMCCHPVFLGVLSKAKPRLLCILKTSAQDICAMRSSSRVIVF